MEKSIAVSKALMMIGVVSWVVLAAPLFAEIETSVVVDDVRGQEGVIIGVSDAEQPVERSSLLSLPVLLIAAVVFLVLVFSVITLIGSVVKGVNGPGKLGGTTVSKAEKERDLGGTKDVTLEEK